MIFVTLDNEPIPFNLVVTTEDEKRRYHKVNSFFFLEKENPGLKNTFNKKQAQGRKMIRLQRKTIRTRELISPVWSEETALDLIYANIRNLLTFSNGNMYNEDKWEMLYETPIKEGDTNHVRLYTQQSQDQSITCLKLESIAKASPHNVFTLALDNSRRKEWDSLFQVSLLFLFLFFQLT